MYPMTTPYKGRLTTSDQSYITQYLEDPYDTWSVRGIANDSGLPYSQVRRYVEWRNASMATLLQPPDGPKILVFDVETAPLLTWNWGLWKQNALATEQDWYMLSFAYGWYDLDSSSVNEVDFVSIFQDPKFKPRTTDDNYALVRLWKLLDQAEIVIGHNSDRFDIRKANDRFSQAGLGPPSPFQTVDTMKEDKRYFARTSHSLKSLSEKFSDVPKMKAGGIDLWLNCMAGDQEAWDHMEEYNRTDVVATAQVYTKLRPWMGMPGKRAHPNLGLLVRSTGWVCPNCANLGIAYGGLGFVKRGFHGTPANRYQTVQCNKCGTYNRLAKAEAVAPELKPDLR